MGKLVFAANCAECHSSKRPPPELAEGSDAQLKWFQQSVLADDFLTDNFLSDDRRYPITRIGTNAGRPVGDLAAIVLGIINELPN